MKQASYSEIENDLCPLDLILFKGTGIISSTILFITKATRLKNRKGNEESRIKLKNNIN